MARYDLAEPEFRCAIIDEPSCGELRAYHSVTLRMSGQLDEALEEAKEACRFSPGDDFCLWALGSTLIACGRSREAVSVLSDAIRIRPDYSEYFSTLSIAQLNLGEFEEALSLANQSLALDPRGLDALRGRAMALFRLGRTTEAQLTVDSALSHYPLAADLFRIKGQHLLAAGLPTQATESFREALRIDPSAKNVQLALRRSARHLFTPYRMLIGYHDWWRARERREREGALLWMMIGVFMIGLLDLPFPALTPLVLVVQACGIATIFYLWKINPITDAITSFLPAHQDLIPFENRNRWAKSRNAAVLLTILVASFGIAAATRLLRPIVFTAFNNFAESRERIRKERMRYQRIDN